MRILVEGDSWAYTWSAGSGENTAGPGFAQLLRNCGWQVDCTARAGSSNLASVSRVEALYKDYDLVIWLQTEPIRDWLHPQEHHSRLLLAVDPLLDRVRLHGGLDPAISQYLREETYRRLAAVPRTV